LEICKKKIQTIHKIFAEQGGDEKKKAVSHKGTEPQRKPKKLVPTRPHCSSAALREAGFSAGRDRD